MTTVASTSYVELSSLTSASRIGTAMSHKRARRLSTNSLGFCRICTIIGLKGGIKRKFLIVHNLRYLRVLV